MAGINQGQPEVAVGEPIRFGDIDGFELEQHPVSDRLIVRDTANGTVAYVRADRGGSIGGDGVLIKALKESKPMADTGRTYDTIQQAERAASSWVFVPPGTYNESVDINTQGLTLQGSGYNTELLSIYSNADDVTVKSLLLRNSQDDSIELTGNNCLVYDVITDGAGKRGIEVFGDDTSIISCRAIGSVNDSISHRGTNGIVSNCHVSNSGRHGVIIRDPSIICSNNVINNSTNIGIYSLEASNSIVASNRVISSGETGIRTVNSDYNIVANNRVSDSTNYDFLDGSTGTLLDGNLTGASN